MMNKRRLFWGGVLVLFSVLLFISLSAGFVDTLFDYRTFSGLRGSTKFGVATTNPVGIFGMIISYWGYYIFGNHFIYLMNLLLLVFGLVLFFPERSNFLLTKVFSFFVVSLFFYFFVVQLDFFSTPVGFLADNYLVFFAQIFGETGSAIVTFFLFFFFLVVFVELRKICDFFGFTGKMALKVYKGSENAYREAKKISWKDGVVFSFCEKKLLPFLQKSVSSLTTKKQEEEEVDTNPFQLPEQDFPEAELVFAGNDDDAKQKQNKEDTKITEKFVPHRTSTESKQNQAIKS